MADPIKIDGQNQQQNQGQGTQQQGQQQQTNTFDDLRGKKGFKDNEAFAKSYTEIESSYGRTQNALNSAKQGVETQSQGNYTLDDKGGVILTEKGQQSQQQQGQGGYGQQGQNGQQGYQQQGNYQQEPVYDPYTNQIIQDPVALQLARLPLGQREAFMFNAMSDQREKQQISAFQHETEILSSEGAKGFEQDIKKVMMAMPLAQRSDKKAWDNAVLQVKGARYDNDKQNWGQQANDNLLNKMGNQGLPAGSQSSGGSGSQLPQQLETQYQWYEKNRPGFFKDRAEFMKFTTPTGGK